MSIPIRNIYYLLCYAWDRLEARDLVDVGALSGDRPENLLGKILEVGVGHLVRQGLDRGYVEVEEEGPRLRGKFLFGETLSRGVLPAGRVVCEVDELSHDVPHNRVIKAAMRALLSCPTLDGKIRRALQAHCQRLHDVADVPLSSAAFRNIQLHRNVARYALLVNVASLVARSFFPDERTGEHRFHPFTANEQEMGRIFESFVRNFLIREQADFEVTSPKVEWDVAAEESSQLAWLPDMRTDVVLTSPSARIVIETKCYAKPLRSYFGGSAKLISDHLYQLLTYVSQLAATEGPPPVGLLLYAGPGSMEGLTYRIGGHRILVRSLDLNRDWQDIHAELLALAAEHA